MIPSEAPEAKKAKTVNDRVFGSNRFDDATKELLQRRSGATLFVHANALQCRMPILFRDYENRKGMHFGNEATNVIEDAVDVAD